MVIYFLSKDKQHKIKIYDIYILCSIVERRCSNVPRRFPYGCCGVFHFIGDERDDMFVHDQIDICIPRIKYYNILGICILHKNLNTFKFTKYSLR